MADAIDFLGWVRPAVGALVTGIEQGRSRAAAQLTLTARDRAGASTGTDSATLAFLLSGPRDVIGLQPGAIRRRFPAPGVLDAETTKCPYVEFADPGLPWRYTPGANPTPDVRALRPWLVLLVGTDAELQITGDQVMLDPVVRAQHPLAASARWAHVQRSAGRELARLLSGRPLAEETDYVAVLVPAFSTAADGTLVDAWAPAGPATVKVYDTWRFRTGPRGDFPALAQRLRAGLAPAGTGRGAIRYVRLPGAAALELRGALAPLNTTDAALPADIAADLAEAAKPLQDPRGRPVLNLPVYGAAWRADPASEPWSQQLNGDPRFRGVAAIGVGAGIHLEEALVDEAVAQAGALREAAQRLRELTLGLAAGGGLWSRRFPEDPQRRLWVLGPALRRLLTDDGTVDELATAEGRALPGGVFSSTVRRIVRPGPARTALAGSGAIEPAALLGGANRCPVPDEAVEVGIPLTALGAGDFADRVRQVVGDG